jgi:hypothetical protein
MILATTLGIGLWVQPSSARVGQPGDRLWVSAHDEGLDDVGIAVVASPDAGKVFVAGYAFRDEEDPLSYDYLTIGYDTMTGDERWVALYDGAGGGDQARAAAVSPDGTRVFVTGFSYGGSGAIYDYATVAYDAVTGSELWVQRYDGGYDDPESLAVSPDGMAVYVTGSSESDYVTVAYDASTGAQRWVQRYSGPGSWGDQATSVAAAPDGSSVIVTGHAGGNGGSELVCTTIAYDSATGAERWIGHFDGATDCYGEDVAVSPDSSMAIVTGYGYRESSRDFITLAYDVSTGTLVWTAYFDAPEDQHDNEQDEAYALAVSPDGTVVVVTGKSSEDSGYYDYATVAYDAATGVQLWARVPGKDLKEDVAWAVAVSPDSRAVYVTGDTYSGLPSSRDFGTVAYRLGTGERLWQDRLNGVDSGWDYANDVAVSPNGSAAFITGTGNGSESDILTVAYATSR